MKSPPHGARTLRLQPNDDAFTARLVFKYLVRSGDNENYCEFSVMFARQFPNLDNEAGLCKRGRCRPYEYDATASCLQP